MEGKEGSWVEENGRHGREREQRERGQVSIRVGKETKHGGKNRDGKKQRESERETYRIVLRRVRFERNDRLRERSEEGFRSWVGEEGDEREEVDKGWVMGEGLVG